MGSIWAKDYLVRDTAQITEVGPRDGLQNEKGAEVSVADKLRFIELLADAGLGHIEAGAFVNPRAVPQMAGSRELFEQLNVHPELGKSPVVFSALVPNEKGMQEALACGVKKIAVFTAASETFNQKNINTSIAGSFERFTPVLKLARDHSVAVRGYVSTAFVCPYEGEIKSDVAAEVIKQLIDLGIGEISIGDTIGKATPVMVKRLMEKLLNSFDGKIFWMHFHDMYGPVFERGTALPNVESALELGLRQFDASAGGLGGCPYAPGASGNISTNDLVHYLHTQGYGTGIDLEKLNVAGRFIQRVLGRKLPSRVL